jgi:hypothetical protein
MSKKLEAEERARAIRCIAHRFPAGSAIPLEVVAVARDGMSRQISVADGKYDLDVARILGLRETRHGVVVRGTGMDMAFWLASALGHAVHGDERSLTYSTKL